MKINGVERVKKKGKIIISSVIVMTMAVSTFNVSALGNIPQKRKSAGQIVKILPKKIAPAVQMFNENDFWGEEIPLPAQPMFNMNDVPAQPRNRYANKLDLSRMLPQLRALPKNLKLAAKTWHILKYAIEYTPDIWTSFTSRKKINLDKAIDNLENSLQKVVGQEKQKETLLSTIVGILGESDFMDKDKKVNIIYMAGPSGVGKTYCAELVARSLNGNKPPFTISPANIDFNKKITVEQLFGLQTNMWDFLSEGKSENSLIDYVERTAHPVIVVNEYDKMHSRELDEIFRVITDDTKITISGRKMDFSGATFIFTSNESHNSLLCNLSDEIDNDETGSRTKVVHDPSFMNRVYRIEFDNLTEENYKIIAKKSFEEVAAAFEKKYGIKVNVEGMIESAAKRACQLNRGSRPIINDLKNSLIRALTQGRIENAKQGNTELKAFNVEYNFENDEIKTHEVNNTGEKVNEKTLNVVFIEKVEPSYEKEDGLDIEDLMFDNFIFKN